MIVSRVLGQSIGCLTLSPWVGISGHTEISHLCSLGPGLYAAPADLAAAPKPQAPWRIVPDTRLLGGLHCCHYPPMGRRFHVMVEVDCNLRKMQNFGNRSAFAWQLHCVVTRRWCPRCFEVVLCGVHVCLSSGTTLVETKPIWRVPFAKPFSLTWKKRSEAPCAGAEG